MSKFESLPSLLSMCLLTGMGADACTRKLCPLGVFLIDLSLDLWRNFGGQVSSLTRGFFVFSKSGDVLLASSVTSSVDAAS